MSTVAHIMRTEALPSRSQFDPGQVWYDTDGQPINAHGGGLLYHRGTYYWYGEHKVAGLEGNKAQVGVSCYSSVDLYSWRNEGIALPRESLCQWSKMTRPMASCAGVFWSGLRSFITGAPENS